MINLLILLLIVAVIFKLATREARKNAEYLLKLKQRELEELEDEKLFTDDNCYRDRWGYEKFNRKKN